MGEKDIMTRNLHSACTKNKEWIGRNWKFCLIFSIGAWSAPFIIYKLGLAPTLTVGSFGQITGGSRIDKLQCALGGVMLGDLAVGMYRGKGGFLADLTRCAPPSEENVATTIAQSSDHQ